MDEKQLAFAAAELSLDDEVLQTLQRSQVNDRREALMASTGKIWGLNVWIKGDDYVLLDEKGFVCSTRKWSLVAVLCQFESAQGSGALRSLLRRPIKDPYAAIFLANPPKRLPPPVNTPTLPSKPTMAPDRFASLLGEI